MAVSVSRLTQGKQINYILEESHLFFFSPLLGCFFSVLCSYVSNLGHSTVLRIDL